MAKKMTLEELMAEQGKTERELKIAKQNLRILESEEKRRTRNQRTHRLCNHGGLLETFLPPDQFTDQQMEAILKVLFHTPQAKELMAKIRKEADNPSGQSGRGQDISCHAALRSLHEQGAASGYRSAGTFQRDLPTAEDGLGDTVKPRLIEAGADLDKVLVIVGDEANPLTLADDRIERAIRQNQARLLIIDPIQAFLGAKVDMNRANEVRPIFRKLGDIAQRTGCAVLLIGHLNKAVGVQSTYRGLGSIDFTAPCADP